MIISAWCLQTSSKFSGQEFKKIGSMKFKKKFQKKIIQRNIESMETSKQVRISLVNATKSVRVVQQFASDDVRGQENKYEQQQQLAKGFNRSRTSRAVG